MYVKLGGNACCRPSIFVKMSDFNSDLRTNFTKEHKLKSLYQSKVLCSVLLNSCTEMNHHGLKGVKMAHLDIGRNWQLLLLHKAQDQRTVELQFFK